MRACVCVCVGVCVCVCWGWAAGNTRLQLARPGVAVKRENSDVAAREPWNLETLGSGLQVGVRQLGWVGHPAAPASSLCCFISLCTEVLKEQEGLELISTA